MLEKQRLLTLSNHAIIAPVQRHPQSKEAEEQIKALCEVYRIALANIDEYNTMTSYMYPHTTLERLVTIGLWVNFLWFIDDSYDRNTNNEYTENQLGLRKVLEDCVLIICRGWQVDESENVLYPVSRELWQRLSSMASPQWLKRFEFSLLQHLKAATYSIEDTLVNGKVSVERFITLREIDGGMYPTIDCIEFAFDMFLPDEVLLHEKIQNIIRLTAYVATFSNDIFSYEKEALKLGSRFNLVNVFMEGQNLSFEEALHHSILLINNASDELQHVKDDLPIFGNKLLDYNVRKYVCGLVDQASAAYHWQMSTLRYRSPYSPFEELRQPLL